ncbi:MAG: polysaccharide deacetylase family protein [Proteobacteria bacterium]|nr:polysaccharide deacetylase family protein [Pseudomonadota bacterium]
MKWNSSYGSWIVLVCVAMFFGCMHDSFEYSTGNYVVVETIKTDTLETLAGKYLNDTGKAWVISEFNKIKDIKPGQKIIVPLQPFNIGGIGPEGYQLVPVLNYEKLKPTQENQVPEPVASFEQQMDYLKKNNFQVISFTWFMEFLNYTCQIPEKSLVITLDDNTRAVMDIALPVLEKYGYPATLFLDPANVGTENGLSVEDLYALKEKGMAIQCRAGWAIDADVESKKITLNQYFEALKKEIPRSKAYIEEISGSPCLYYALPPSGGNNLLNQFLWKSGFKASLTMDGEANPFFADHFNIERVTISPYDSAGNLATKLSVFRKMELK